MKKLLKLPILLTLTLFSALVYAAVVSVSWDAPTSRADGTPLADSEILEYRIYRVDGIDKTQIWSGKSGSQDFDIPNGETWKVVATTVDIYGMESVDSNVIVISRSAPNPPILRFLMGQ